MEAAVDQFFKEIGDIVAPDPGKDHDNEDEVLEHPYGKYCPKFVDFMYCNDCMYYCMLQLMYIGIISSDDSLQYK